jgi:hypothetical protein
MRWIWLVAGVVLLGVGVVWILQGFNVLANSAMSGKTGFILLGLLVGIVGLVLLGVGITRRQARVG